ncbi:MAG: hypothetical protein R3E76_14785 [Planctomycetota bacterium]
MKHHVAAANRSSRYALNAIALTERGTRQRMGTLCSSYPTPKSLKDAPKVDGVNSKAKPPKLALLDPADGAKAAAMVSAKGRKSTLPAFNLIHVEVKKGIVMGATNSGGARVMTMPAGGGAIPDVSVVIP